MVNVFVKSIDVMRKRITVFHVTPMKRNRLEIFLKVDATIFTGQDMLQGQDKIPIVFLLFMGRFVRVIKTHGV